jgi:diamine N-acetyltransferase
MPKAGAAPAGRSRSVLLAEIGNLMRRSTAAVGLQLITDRNVKAVCELKVAPNQEHLVAANVRSLAEAYADYGHAWPRALVRDGQVVGFLMLEIDLDDEDGPPYWLWRLMVGASHQRQGVATAASALAFEEVRSRGGAEIFTSSVPGDGSPEPFYLGLGFEPNGEVDDGEIVARSSSPMPGPSQRRSRASSPCPPGATAWPGATHSAERARTRCPIDIPGTPGPQTTRT